VSVAIVDYGLGNLTSVAGAFSYLGASVVVTADPDELRAAERLVLPGVGAFADGMGKLRQRRLVEPLTEIVRGGKPILGICLGAQLLCRSSDEFGNHAGLGWIAGDVRRIETTESKMRLPHVGWNELQTRNASPLLKDIPNGTLLYFCHSHAIRVDEPDLTIGVCSYGEVFVAAFQKNNIFGVQAHPEKSQRAGLKILENFLSI
jgi:glutamine amidotransferase